MVLVDAVKTAIVDRENEIIQKFEQEHIIKREATLKLSTDVAMVITGVRRCGKSIFAYMNCKGIKCAYVNFEDERLNISANDLNTVLEAIYELKGNVDVLIFDEIQNVVGWERFVARLLSSKKIIVTGSNARLLSKELSTFLTGRHMDLTLFPFSFREFCLWKRFVFSNSTKDISQAKVHLREYIEKGAFPLAYKLGNVFLTELYRDIIERDIVQRYGIKHVAVLKGVAKYLISHHGREFSYNQLRKLFVVKSVHTIKNYISYLESAYIILKLERFSFKLKEQALTPKKAYCIDTGIIRVIGFQSSEDRGRIFENIVAIELWRNGLEIYYWKDHQQREVDFVIKKSRKVEQLIQVCADITHAQTKARETRSLLTACQELRCKNLIIITEDYEAREKIEGKEIKFIPLWKWLIKA